MSFGLRYTCKLILFCRPIPEKEFVEGYIKAYYLPESQLDVWLQDHKVFTIQVTGKILSLSKQCLYS